MKKAEKPFVVQDLAARIKDAKSFVVLDYQGLAVRELSGLRRKIKEVGGRFVVAKNTLLKLALKAAKLETGNWKLETALVGPTAVVFAEEDELAPLQILGKFSSETGLLKFKFGLLGKDLFDGEKLARLSRLPAKNILLGQLVGLVTNPAYGLITTLNTNLQKLVYILKAKGATVR